MNMDELMLWVMHSLSDAFREHAILKGGMHMMLLSSERATNDLDYVFVPFESKMEIVDQLHEVLRELPEVKIEKSLHSNCGRFLVSRGDTSVQIEFNVSTNVPSEPVTTELLAKKTKSLPRVIRVMSKEVAMAHKLAAWNERRLARDLYDIYFWYAQVGALPDHEVLKSRLEKISSRLPKMRKIKSMSPSEFWTLFSEELDTLDEEDFTTELRPLLPAEKIEGLFMVLKSKLLQLASHYLK